MITKLDKVQNIREEYYWCINKLVKDSAMKNKDNKKENKKLTEELKTSKTIDSRKKLNGKIVLENLTK